MAAIHSADLGGYFILCAVLIIGLHIFLILRNGKNRLPGYDEMAKEWTIQNVEEGLLVIDKTGRVLFSNKVVCSFLQKELFKPWELVQNNIAQIENEGCIYEVRWTKLPKESKIEGYLIRFVDVTQLMCQKNELLELKEKADAANQFKSAFLANMSHEIRTPIHAIIGFSELVMKEEISEDTKEKLDMIKSSSHNLLAIINDVLDISKIESGKMELVMTQYYISNIIHDINATFALMAMSKGLSFCMDIDESIPGRLYGDKVRIRGILVNILNNAVKYTREGRVEFAVRRLEQTEDKVKLAFVIKDTGIGIKEEDRPQLFESFYRLDRQANESIEGTGLGLSISYAYASMMGGEIQVESEYGKGSVFTVILEQQIVDPAPIDMKYVYEEKEEKHGKFQIRDYEMLIVDDNQVNLKVAKGLLKSYGIKVDTAGGGCEAVELCRTKAYPLIFMDQMMPEMDGKTAMDEIRKLSDFYRQEAQIIVLTADAMSGARKRLMKEGFSEYLCKPLEVQRLEQLLLKIVPEEKVVWGAAESDTHKEEKD